MKRRTLLIVLIVILLLAITAGALVYFGIIDLGGSRQVAPTIKKEYPVPIPGNIITNIKNSRKFVRCELVVILDDEKESKSLETETYIVKDMMLEILRSTEELDLRAEDIQDRLSEKLIAKMDDIHDYRSIVKVYFKQLITQGQ